MTKRGKEIDAEFRAFTFPNAKNTLLISQYNHADTSSISYLFDGDSKKLSRVVKIEGGKVHSANTDEHKESAKKAIRFLAQHLVTRKD